MASPEATMKLVDGAIRVLILLALLILVVSLLAGVFQGHAH
jgi:hypothetical protein